MNKDFMVVHKSVLPDCLEQVIKAKNLIETNKLPVNEACRKCYISRSTFYKYKDKVFEMADSFSRKAILSVHLLNVPGALSEVLNEIYKYGVNIITINQDGMIKNIAYVTLMIDTGTLNDPVIDLLNSTKKLDKVKDITLTAFE